MCAISILPTHILLKLLVRISKVTTKINFKFIKLFIVSANVIICEGGDGYIYCPSGSSVDVQFANYGRTRGPAICPHPSPVLTRNRNCVSLNSLTIVRSECQGRQRCSLRANNGVFGNPCPATYKYLQVEYNCVSILPPDVIVCEGQSRTISCSGETRINVRSANFGRTEGPTVCPHPSIQTTDCSAPVSLERVRDRCQGQTTCILEASNNIFGDPCPGTYKYLQVDFNCVAPDNIITCEGQSRTISCLGGTTIYVQSANYGRTEGASVCPHPSIQTTDCTAPESLERVRDRCQGQTTCIIEASNNIFGDPCPGTYKYLEVEFVCV